MNRCICVNIVQKNYMLPKVYLLDNIYKYESFPSSRMSPSPWYCVYTSEGSPGGFNSDEFKRYFMDLQEFRQNKINQIIENG